MGTFLKITLPLLLFTAALSAIAGYAYGLHSSRHVVGARPHATAALRVTEGAADASVLAPPASWTRWPSLTDF